MSNWFRSRHSPTEKERAENQEVGLIVNFLFLLPDDTLLYPITLVITFAKLSHSSSTVSSSVPIISSIACQPINRSVIRLSKITRFNYSRSSIFVFQFRKCRVPTYDDTSSETRLNALIRLVRRVKFSKLWQGTVNYLFMERQIRFDGVQRTEPTQKRGE